MTENGESQRKQWNERQGELRRALSRLEQHDEAIRLFLIQHAPLHSRAVSDTGGWSYEDEILDDITDEAARRIPRGGEHSVVWCMWHLARIEDVTMNILVAGEAQLLQREGWLERLHAPACDTGNAMSSADTAMLSASIDFAALRAYRQAVGRRTREIVRGLSADDLKRKVEPVRLERVKQEGAVVPAGYGVIEYWGNLTIAGLLLMPPTRHCFIHLNEAMKLKRKRA